MTDCSESFEERFAQVHLRDRLLAEHARQLADREHDLVWRTAALDALEQHLHERQRQLMARLVFLHLMAGQLNAAA